MKNLKINQNDISLVEVIENEIKNGMFFSVTWVKKNGEIRTASVKKCKWINTSGISRKHPEQYTCLVDMNKLQRKGNGYVLIDKDSILMINANKKQYVDWRKVHFGVNLGMIDIEFAETTECL